MFKYLLVFFLLFSGTLFCETIIENFDDGEIELFSFDEDDYDPDDWELNSDNTFNDSPFSLRIFGNTWKEESIEAVQIDTNEVWKVSLFVEDESEIHGFGIKDSLHHMIYTLHGSQELPIETFIPVYQGEFPENQWNEYYLPIADDWFAWYEYYPTITSLVFINDDDSGAIGECYFDEVVSIDLPFVPEVDINFDIGPVVRRQTGEREVEIQFYADVYDEDCTEFEFLWQFGDDSLSVAQNPVHTFFVEDDHPYTVMLEVTDDSQTIGYATCNIIVDEGESELPISMNFVGDVMMARYYTSNGGIIPTLGVDAIFEPTLDILGNAADVTVANLECPFTTHDVHHPTKSVYFKGHPDYVSGLTYAGIDIVSLANNHSTDYMLEGLQETQQVLRDNNILFSGAGEDSYEAYLPLFYNKAGINFAFLANSDRTGQYNNAQPFLQAGYNKPGFAYLTPYYITEQVAAVEDYADFIIMESHCGSEYSTGPGSDYDKSGIWTGHSKADYAEDEDYTPRSDIPHMWDVEYRHHMIDSGVDMVIGHHPHIIQGLEIYNGKLIAHSLGNFAFDLSYPETFPSVILSVDADTSGFGNYTLKPVYIDDYIPKPATGELGLYILEDMVQKSKDMNTYLTIDREEISALVLADTLDMGETEHTYDRTAEFAEIDAEWISKPIHFEKNGNISSMFGATLQNLDYRLGREVIWFGNMEDEGCTLWNINSDDEWYDEDESLEGERSICHRRLPNSGDNIVTNFEKRIKIYSGGAHTLHGNIKTFGASDVTIEIKYYNTRTGNQVGDEDIGTSISGTNDWEYFHKELDIPDNANYFDIRLSSDCPNVGTAYAWFDNVGVIQWTDWDFLNANQEVESPNNFFYTQLKSGSHINQVILSCTETNYQQGPVVNAQQDDINPVSARLCQNYPNPFNPTTTIRFETTNFHEDTRIEIYNIKGQRVKSFDAKSHPELAEGSIVWHGKDDKGKNVGSGVYFYKLTVGKTEVSKKMVLIK